MEPLELEAPVLEGAPLVRTVGAAGLPDLAAPVVGAPPPVRIPAAARGRSDLLGVPPDAGTTRFALGAAGDSRRTTRPALEAAASPGCVAPLDCEDDFAAASEA